jgi:hypothetical protein
MIANYNFVGTYTNPTEAANTAALGTVIMPVMCQGLAITFTGVTFVLKRLQIMLNNQIAMRYDVNGTNGIAYPRIVDCDVQYLATIEYPAFSLMNIRSVMNAETKVTLAAVIGAAAGNIITIGADAYIHDINETEENGILMAEVAMSQSWRPGETLLNFIYT